MTIYDFQGLRESLQRNAAWPASGLGCFQFAKFHSKFTNRNVDLVFIVFFHKRFHESLAQSVVSFFKDDQLYDKIVDTKFLNDS